jgi:hypothetical protein
LRRDFSKKLNIDSMGVAKHNSCISHCLPYAFGECNLPHTESCENCESLFSFFETLHINLQEEEQQKIQSYQDRLIAFMAHHIRKAYLNAQFSAQFSQLDTDGALIIVDYKMKILPRKARETKNEFFGKRGWSLHSVLVYMKDNTNGKLNVEAFDHWSNDTRQDAWFTVASLHTVMETLEQKPKWITIVSDNGGHYHNTELMMIMGHWKEWYNIHPRRWLFLEAGEAKTAIDSHHAQVYINTYF